MIDLLTETPQTKRALAEKAGCPVREVEAMIQAARLDGVPILSDGDGYRISNDPQEVARCAERLRERALTQLATAGALSTTASRLRAPRLTLW